MTVISGSRRTDIPAFYSAWFMNRIRDGYVRWGNPFSRLVHSISLRPEDVIAFVLWSKNYVPLLPHLDELVGGYFGSNVYWQLIADRTVNNIIRSDKGWRTEYTQGGSLTVTPAEIGPEMQFVLEIDGNTYTADNPPPSTWGVTAKKANGKYELTYPKGKPGAK